jgi:nucleoside 2-deoxyribosyltransferase
LIKSHYGEYELKKIPAEYIGECAYFYCSKFEQVKKICNFLKVSGEIDYAHTKNDEEKITISITPQGWKKIAILENSKSFEDSDKAFLAMWFNEATDAYRDAVKTAVAEAGYSTEEMIADEARHNDFIMNKVLNMINDAKFVIADFTCAPEENNTDRVKNGVRGGVYFEAGYARGQGKQVIHTSKEDDESRKRIHFDIAQINTIYWNTGDGNQLKDEKDFIDRLKNAIIATVGKGPGG